MSPRPGRYLGGLAIVLAACAPPLAVPPVPPPVPALAPIARADTFSRPLVRPIEVPEAFAAAVERGTRTLDGRPGPAYWQQRVRYEIQVELDPRSTRLRGAERIVYRNHAPETLASVVLNLYQNIFSEGVPRNRYVPVTGGVSLERVAVQGQALRKVSAARLPVRRTPDPSAEAGYSVQGTLARIQLPAPLAPGDSVELEVEWTHLVPPVPSFRTGWEEALGGRAFQVAQWYPQIATFDDLDGWDASPYLGDGEFYLEYGDFDVAISVPAGWLVGATGTLQNPAEVLTEEARSRLAAALRSDSTTAIVTEADLDAGNATQPSTDGQLTWRFRAENVRDFGFATSGRYLWDATRAAVPGEGAESRAVAVHAFYRPGAPLWNQAARFGQHATTYLSREQIPYPYPQITIAEGPIGGMEYPMLVFIGRPQRVEPLYGVIAHEIAHQWFPMATGSNEAAYAWMDEGLITYYEALARDDYFGVADSFRGDLVSYLAVAGRPAEVPLMRHTDLVSPYGARAVAAYTKPGVLMRALRSVVGDSVFREAMNAHARDWLLKHPTPWDFFHTFVRVSGRELDWFFYPWWFETGVLDQAIAGVDASAAGVTVRVRDLGDVPMPTPIVATTANGVTLHAEIPVESWLHGAREATVVIPSTEPVLRVEIDPDLLFPDAVRANNVWVP